LRGRHVIAGSGQRWFPVCDKRSICRSACRCIWRCGFRPSRQYGVGNDANALRAYLDVCLNGVGDQGKLVSALRQRGFSLILPPMAAGALRGQPGSAWMRPEVPAGTEPLIVVVRPQGVQCEVAALVADLGGAATGFQERIQVMGQPPLQVRRTLDEARAPDGGPGRFMMYEAGVPPMTNGFNFAISVRPPRSGQLALLLTASRATLR